MNLFNAINKYRRAHWLYRHGLKVLARIYEMRIYQAHNSFIPASCEIGNGTLFGYKGIGVVVHKRAKIGNNCKIHTGAKILGPITLGDNVEIGANAVVIHDCPPNTVWGGVPARCLKTIDAGEKSLKEEQGQPCAKQAKRQREYRYSSRGCHISSLSIFDALLDSFRFGSSRGHR